MYNFDRQIHAEIEWGYYMYLLDEYVGERAKAMNNRLTNEFESAELENSIKILKINIDLHEKFVKRILKRIRKNYIDKGNSAINTDNLCKKYPLPNIEIKGCFNEAQYLKKCEENLDELVYYNYQLEKEREKRITINEYIDIIYFELERQKSLLKDLYRVTRRKNRYFSEQAYKKIVELINYQIFNNDFIFSEAYEKQIKSIQELINN